MSVWVWVAGVLVLLAVVGLLLAYALGAGAARADRMAGHLADLPDIDPDDWAAVAARLAAFREFLTEHPELLALPRYEDMHHLYLTPRNEETPS